MTADGGPTGVERSTDHATVGRSRRSPTADRRTARGRKGPATAEEQAARKRARFAKRYGLTVEQLDKLERISPVCDICGRAPLPGKKLYLDHDHKTGRVRGRLCFTDNYRLLGRGALNDPARHESAAQYLRSTFDGRKL